jgi:hypothetical protein
VTWGWREVHNEELHNLYYSLNIIRIIKSRRMQWTEHVVGVGEIKTAYLKRRHGLDDVDMDLIEIRWEGVDWIGRVATSCEHCNELSGSAEGEEFLEELHDG